ncbi:MAG TPA: toll/interleukin-1 receptor domain-containing protein [Chloroflexia bacterium]|nr:toll/interleukin-1 receptor domain-containing protein [Chloroflexia bacterium]
MDLMLNGPQLQQLHRALLDAFPTQSELTQMVRFGLSENLEAIAGGGTLSAIVFNLLQWAGARNKYATLIGTARAANPDSRLLRDFAASVGLGDPPVAAVPASADPAPVLAPPANPPPAVVPTATAGSDPAIHYDIFVSYAAPDQNQVRNELLPALEKAGLTVCLDRRDFQLGLPIVENIEQAIANSRYTLLVLTPSWVTSQWTRFEALLTASDDPAGQRSRVIPLLLEPVQLPAHIRYLTPADFTDPAERPEQLARLIRQLKSPAAPAGPVATESPPVPAPESPPTTPNAKTDTGL